jgi:ribonuclease BN (tRNA processing enzyme)
VFNDRLFPDLLSRPPSAAAPFLVTHEIPLWKRTAIGDHHVTAVPVSHPIPTLAVLVERGRSAVLIATDTGPADEVWRFAAGVKNLKAVFLDVAFPEALGWLADVSGHLTPSRFAAEVRKVPPGVPVYAIHLKPRYREAVRNELAALGLDRVSVMEPGRTYQF